VRANRHQLIHKWDEHVSVEKQIKNKIYFIILIIHMEKESGRQIFLLAGFIIVLGVIFILYGYIGFSTASPEKQISLSIGSALLSAGTVGIFSKFFLSGVTSDIIIKKIEEPIEKVEELINNVKATNATIFTEMSSFQKNMRAFSINYPLIMECSKSGIIGIYTDRIENATIKNEVLEEMRKSAHLKMIGTSLRQFFWKDPNLTAKFKEITKSGEKEREIKILISNPFSKSVVKRTLLEEGPKFELECKTNFNHYQQSATYNDVQMTLNNFTLLKSEANSVVQMKLKCYTDFPSMWMVLTDNCVFFQPYQYGKIEETKCIGESFFIMKILAGSPLYQLLNHHFDIVWNDHSNLSVKEMLNVYSNTNSIFQNLSQESQVFWRK